MSCVLLLRSSTSYLLLLVVQQPSSSATAILVTVLQSTTVLSTVIIFSTVVQYLFFTYCTRSIQYLRGVLVKVTVLPYCSNSKKTYSTVSLKNQKRPYYYYFSKYSTVTVHSTTFEVQYTVASGNSSHQHARKNRT